MVANGEKGGRSLFSVHSDFRTKNTRTPIARTRISVMTPIVTWGALLADRPASELRCCRSPNPVPSVQRALSKSRIMSTFIGMTEPP